MESRKTNNNTKISKWSIGLSIIAILISIGSFLLSWINTLPKASIEIIKSNLCIDKRYIEDGKYKDSVYVYLKFQNNSYRRSAEVSTIIIRLKDPEVAAAIFAQHSFIKEPDFMEPGEISPCIIKLNLIRTDTRDLKYSLPLKETKIEELEKIVKDIGLIPSVPLKREINLSSEICYPGECKKIEKDIGFVELFDITKQ